MKITIESETPEETKGLPQPIVRVGVTEIGIAGDIGAEPLMWFSGNCVRVIGGLTRTIEEVRAVLTQKITEAAMIAVHNKIALATQQAATEQEILADINKHGGVGTFPRIARP